MMWGYYSGMGWWMILSSLFWLGLVAVAVWALVRFVAQWTRVNGPRDAEPVRGGPSAEEILRQRYARGEIDDATFQRMHAQLAREPEPERDPALRGSNR